MNNIINSERNIRFISPLVNQGKYKKISSLGLSQGNSLLNILKEKISLLCSSCTNILEEPRICSKCSEIFCSKCLIIYFNKYGKNCPCCHYKGDYSDFKLYESKGLINFLKQNLQNHKKISRQNSLSYICASDEKQQSCVEHSLPMKYYCQNCSQPICSDCGMMSKSHQDHKFIRLSDIYSKIKEKLNLELEQITNKIFESQEYGLIIKKQLQKLQLQHSQIKRYAEEYYILLMQKFQEQISSKSIFLKEVQEKNTQEIDFYEKYRDDIMQQIEKKAQIQLISEADKLATAFSMINFEKKQDYSYQNNFINSKEQNFESVKQILPQYNYFKYEFNNFSLASGIVYSQTFLFNNIQWRLKIYPKGNGVAKGKYLSVFVQMTKAQTNQKKYQYKIQLVNKQVLIESGVHSNIHRQYCSSFDIGQCWGYNQFILLQQLENGYLQNDKLYFILGIRCPDYRSLSVEQSKYIQHLQNQIKLKQLEKKNAEIQQQRNVIDDLCRQGLVNEGNSKILKFCQSNEQKIQDRRVHQAFQRDRQKPFQKNQHYHDILRELADSDDEFQVIVMEHTQK